jgi:hypothetical protein
MALATGFGTPLEIGFVNAKILDYAQKHREEI